MNLLRDFALLGVTIVALVAGAGLRRLRGFVVLLLLSPAPTSFALLRILGGGHVVRDWVQVAVRDDAVWLRENLRSHV